MRGDDRDAMWRPGYTGAYAYPAPPVERSRPPRWIAMGAVLAVVASGLAFAVAWRADREAGDSGPLPERAQPQWAIPVADVSVTRVVASPRVVVLEDDAADQLVALDARTGAERWRHGYEFETTWIVEQLVVGVAVGKGTRDVAALSLDDGDVVWTRRLGAADRLVADRGQILLLQPGGGAEGGSRLERLEPMTGRTNGQIDADVISWTRTQISARNGAQVTVIDRTSFDLLGAADLAALGLGDTDASVAVGRSGTIVAGGSSILLVDEHGESRASLPLARAVEGATRVGLDVLDDAGRYVAVQQGDRLTVLSTDGGSLRELWSGSAWLVDWHLDAERQLVAIAGTIGSVVTLPPQVVDVMTGAPAWDGPAAVQQASPLRVFAGNGFIAVQGAGRGGGAPTVVGYDLDRTERWRRQIGRRASPALVAAGLVTVEPGADGSTMVTLYA